MPYKRHLAHLNRFHYHYNFWKQQWEQHISSELTHQMWGDPETITEKLIRHQLVLLGYSVRMENYWILKRTLFDWPPQKHPLGGPRKRWRDVVLS